MDYWDPVHYDKASRRQAEMADRLLSHYTFADNESILDIGCGPGRITQRIALSVPEGLVVGVDASHQMIGYAKQSYRQVANLSFVQQDVCKLQLPERFHLAVSFNCLHWVTDQERALRGIHAHLREEGLLMAVLDMAPPPQAFSQALADTAGEEPWKPYLEHFKLSQEIPHIEAEAYHTLLHHIGFEVMMCEWVTYTYHFPTIQVLVDDIMGWLPQAGWIPQSERRRFVEQVVEAYLAKEPSLVDGANIVMRRPIIEVTARRKRKPY